MKKILFHLLIEEGYGISKICVVLGYDIDYIIKKAREFFPDL